MIDLHSRALSMDEPQKSDRLNSLPAVMRWDNVRSRLKSLFSLSPRQMNPKIKSSATDHCSAAWSAMGEVKLIID
ncbi:hypothetical protein ABK905_23390 [Acerihabitans sp. KWT182]|uniref:Uncharacterized protein n=1 Tax=Acerihabitans sp. KWT182 TaxID=3157919 RepID=A0AAU7QAU2_9GAMM